MLMHSFAYDLMEGAGAKSSTKADKTPNLLLDALQLLSTMPADPKGDAPRSSAIGAAFQQMNQHKATLSQRGNAKDLEENLRECSMACEDLHQQAQLHALRDFLGLPAANGQTYEIPAAFQALGLGAYACKKAKTEFRNAQIANGALKLEKYALFQEAPLFDATDAIAFLIKTDEDRLIDSSPQIAERLIAAYKEAGLLNEKEAFCFEQLCLGTPKQEIAIMLGCSNAMISKHIKKILTKLQRPMEEIPALSEMSINQRNAARIDEGAKAFAEQSLADESWKPAKTEAIGLFREIESGEMARIA